MIEPAHDPLAYALDAAIELDTRPAEALDTDAARLQVRNNIGFYVGGMGSRDKNFYNDLFKRYGYEREATEIALVNHFITDRAAHEAAKFKIQMG